MERKNGRKHGEVFTNTNVIQFILDEVNYTADSDLSSVSILEPAAGKGAFAYEIIHRLYKSSVKYHFSFLDSISNICLVELSPVSFIELKKTINTLIYNLTNISGDYASSICLNGDFLDYKFRLKFDCIVANPPYIRHELISTEHKELYRTKFKTFKYRADLYIPFYEKGLMLLKERGILSYICSNRWLNNQYGEELRKLISTEYHLDKLMNIEKSSPFDEDVIAYPCITTISNRNSADKLLFFESDAKAINFSNIKYKPIELPKNGSWQNLFLSYNIEHNELLGILDQGFEIGIGVATGADKIFIKSKSEINGIEKSRLLPLIRSKDLKNNKFKWGEQYVINPYENDALCDLDRYPHLKSYLNENKSILVKRHTSQKTPEKWYKTIDKIKADLQQKPKLLLPDLTGNKLLFIDNGDYYPHHNIYYITGDSIKSLKIMATMLMSDFVRDQMSQIGIRMNGGLPRFQAQVLKKLKIPNIDLLSEKDIETLIQAYDSENLLTINKVIDAYCQKYNIYETA